MKTTTTTMMTLSCLLCLMMLMQQQQVGASRFTARGQGSLRGVAAAPATTPTGPDGTSTSVAAAAAVAAKLDESMDDEEFHRALVNLNYVSDDVPNGSLGRCEGDCDGDENCSGDLVCFKRHGTEAIPGCNGDRNLHPDGDYCVRKQDHPDYQGLGHCEGDCDNDSDCANGMICQHRTPNQVISQCPRSVHDSSRTDYCVNPSSDTRSSSTSSSSNNGGGGGGSSKPRVVSSATKWQRRGTFSVAKPTDMKVGDVLFLILSRSDDVLPVRRSGWSTVASCFKEDNADRTCAVHTKCKERDGDYCKKFEDGRRGLDLATVVFTRPVTQDDVDKWELKVRLRVEENQNHPGWAMVAVVRDADLSNPVRNFATTSCDKSRHSIFPSVSGAKAGDLLMLTMAFDDPAKKDVFKAPAGMSLAAHVMGDDETGFIYQQNLVVGGKTSPRVTGGDGARGVCKDALISMVIRPR